MALYTCLGPALMLAARHAPAQLFPLSRDDFVREVTEASRSVPVVLLLFKDSVDGSPLLTGILQRVSACCVAQASRPLVRSYDNRGLVYGRIPSHPHV